MFSRTLPSVLQVPNNNSISMERALKQIKELLLLVPIRGESLDDMVSASVDDIDTMLAAIDRSGD